MKTGPCAQVPDRAAIDRVSRSRRQLLVAGTLAGLGNRGRAQSPGAEWRERLTPGVVGISVTAAPLDAMGRSIAALVAKAAAASAPAAAAAAASAAAGAPHEGQGSGFFVAPDGHILTAAAGLREAVAISVHLHDGTSRKAQLVGQDAGSGLALLRIAPEAWPQPRLAVAGAVVASGEAVWAAGRVAAGAVHWHEGSVVEAEVEASRSVPYIHTSIALPSELGGGPLVRASTGEVIGVNTLHYRPAGKPASSFATPIAEYRRIEADLRELGRVPRGSIGVVVAAAEPRAASTPPTAPRGVVVRSVREGSAAQSADIRPGDVVLALDGTEVRSASHWLSMLGRTKPGERVVVSLRRRTATFDVRVTTEDSPPRAAAR